MSQERAAAARIPMPPREFLEGLTDPSDRAAAGYGWQAGYAAAVAAGVTPGFEPVKAPAAVAKLYVLAALHEVTTALGAARAKYAADLSGEKPFKLLIAMEEHLQHHQNNGG